MLGMLMTGLLTVGLVGLWVLWVGGLFLLGGVARRPGSGWGTIAVCVLIELGVFLLGLGGVLLCCFLTL